MSVLSILKQKGADVLTVHESQSMAETANIMSVRRIGAVVVLNASDLVVGILSERDIVRAVAAEGGTSLLKPVSEYMTRDVVTCKRDDHIDDLMEVMTGRRIRHIPVVEDGCLCGIVSIGDVVKRKIAEAELEAEALKNYIATG